MSLNQRQDVGSPLKQRLAREIALTGPMTVADYVRRCLHDPEDGYYAVRPRLGPDGDFITAPGVSQMFGELIGLWAVECWRRLGSPPRLTLAEVGPGDGTLMADALRAARLAPDFMAAIELVLIEPSAPLRAAQGTRLAPLGVAPLWVEDLSALPETQPLILIANEVLDCLPARQFVRTETGWAERRIGVEDDGALVFGLTAATGFTPPPWPVQIGQTVETSSAQISFAGGVADRVVRAGGCALLIDYGRDAPGPGDTLQALTAHRKVDPLAEPGHADLTQWADFPTVQAAARQAGAVSPALLTQGDFLTLLGIEVRAERLQQGRPDQAAVIDRQLDRLIGPDQMGRLFKVAAIHAPGFTAPGFEEEF